MGVRDAFSDEEKQAKRETGESILRSIKLAKTDSERVELLCAYVLELEDRIQDLEGTAVTTYYSD